MANLPEPVHPPDPILTEHNEQEEEGDLPQVDAESQQDPDLDADREISTGLEIDLWTSLKIALQKSFAMYAHGAIVGLGVTIVLSIEFAWVLARTTKADPLRFSSSDAGSLDTQEDAEYLVDRDDARTFLIGYMHANNALLYVALWGLFIGTFSWVLAWRPIQIIGLPAIVINGLSLHLGLQVTQAFFHAQYIIFIVHHWLVLRWLKIYGPSRGDLAGQSIQQDGVGSSSPPPGSTIIAFDRIATSQAQLSIQDLSSGQQQQQHGQDGQQHGQHQHNPPQIPFSALSHTMKESIAMFRDICMDGTPIALLKGMILAVLFYALFSNVLWPIYDSSSFINKVILRAIGVPMCFGMLLFLQYIFFLGKSLHMMRYRQLQASTINSLLVIIARLMIATAASSPTNTALLAIATSIVEFLARIFYPFRYILVQWLRTYKKRLLRRAGSAHSVTYVENAGIPPPQSQSSPSSFPSPSQGGVADSHRSSSTSVRTPSATVIAIESHAAPSSSRSSSAPLDPFANPDDPSGGKRFILSPYVRYFRSHQITTNTTTEARVLFSTPFLLYLMHPLQYHYTITFLPSILDVLLSVLIQVAISFFSDLVAMVIEIKYLGLRFDVSHLRDRKTNLIHVLMLLGCTYLAFNSFRDRSEL
eukprot:TRINITY_DN11070_c0_g1_i1.p1 TRINITY_DN11070_c0_g1~~TRINITY_DN11070_c0_g1_i1.p1  ORF type:complete len:645 (-),score=157.18 TRINITY_DN11070_c0_g1_i1:571-2505(-)